MLSSITLSENQCGILSRVPIAATKRHDQKPSQGRTGLLGLYFQAAHNG